MITLGSGKGVMRQRALAILIVVMLGDPVGTRAAVLNVDDRRDDLPGAQFTAVGDAITSASDGDTIVVWPGIYPENLDLRGRRLHLRSRDPLNEAVVTATVLDGFYFGPVIQFRGDETSATTIEGFHITHGATETGGAIHGGDTGMGSAATIRHNLIEHNIALQNGGALYRCSGLIEKNIVRDNSAAQGGGAFAMCNGAFVENLIEANAAERGGAMFACNGPITKNIFTGNKATEGGAIWLTFGECSFNVFDGNSAIDGGAISGGNGAIHDNIIQFNRADDEGGAIFSSGGVIRANTIYKNSAAHGGAVSGGVGEISDNRILGNWATISGGAIYRASGLVHANLIDGNTADGSGGAAAECGGSFEHNTIRSNLAVSGGGALANCPGGVRYNRFEHNSAGEGGALWRCTGQVFGNIFESNRAGRGGALSLCQGTLLHNTFAFNSATTGSAVWTDGSIGLGVRSNIFYRGGGDAALGGRVFGGRYNALVTDNCFFGIDALAGAPAELMDERHPIATGNFTADPRFVNAAAPNPAPGAFPDNDFHLLGGSPCIDRGNLHVLARLPVFDLDGLSRVHGAKPDLGCYERGARPDGDGDGLEDATEKSYRTNPNLRDSDADGLSDMLEIAHETNPLEKDKGHVTLVPDDQPTAADAVLFAFNNERIVLDPGTYYGSLDFGGRAISIQSRQPFVDEYLNTTRIDALGLGPALAVNGVASGEINILGLTILNGRAQAGAAIWADTSPIHIEHCIIKDNEAENGGVIEGGVGAVKDCVFTGNNGLMGGCFARFSGRVYRNRFTLNRGGWGAVFYACDPTSITNNEMTSNTAVIYGGVAFESNGEFRDNVLAGNKAEQGGALYRFGGPIRRNEFKANRAKEGGVLFQCHGLVEENEFRANSARYGGVAYDSDGIFRNNTFAHNIGDIHAGGLFECDGWIQNNGFSGNHALDGGVLVFCSGSIDNNEFVGNWADGSGGVINTCGKSLNGNLFENNRAGQSGGAIHGFYGAIMRNTFRANTSRGGGAIAIGEGTIEANLFEANTAYVSGAIASFSGEIQRNRFIGNVADFTAGAIGSSSGPIQNNLFNANKAQHGAAIQACHRALIAFNTFSGNIASVAGGGVHDSAGITLANNIFSGNGKYALIAYSKSTSPTLVANNSFHNSAGGEYRNYDGKVLADAAAINKLPQAEGNVGGDPKFVSASDFRLRPGSPCIDSGYAKITLTADIDSVPRPLDGNGNGTFKPDIGAHEFFGVRILRPAAGARWSAGATVEVEWQALAQWAGNTVRFELWRGAQRVAILGQASGSGGKIKLTIPSNIPAARDYRLRAISTTHPSIVGENPALITIDRKNAVLLWEAYR